MISSGSTGLPLLEFNKDEITRTAANSLNALVRESARQFLRVLFDEVPVWSGQIQGSFLPLAKRLNNVPQSIRGPIVAKRSRVSEGMSKGSFVLPPRNARNKFDFEFVSDVKYYGQNDRYSNHAKHFKLKKQLPWNTMKAAREAFLDHFNNGTISFKLGVKLTKKDLQIYWVNVYGDRDGVI